MEQTQYNLLFRWFIGLSMDDAVWVPITTTATINQQTGLVLAYFGYDRSTTPESELKELCLLVKAAGPAFTWSSAI